MPEDERPESEKTDAEAATEEPKLDPKTAAAALQADQERRLADCRAEIRDSLRRYQCSIRAWPMFTRDGRTVAAFDVIPQ